MSSADGPYGASDPGASIEVVAARPVLAFPLRWLAPGFTIDGGEPRPGRWGRSTVSVLPGVHHVEVWAGARRPVGRAATSVQVMPGCVTEVVWHPPVWGVGSGRIHATTRLATVDVRQPAGWYDDPSGRWEQRWWDGTAWTNHVQRGGQVVHDVGP